jgi:hypothetical protein
MLPSSHASCQYIQNMSPGKDYIRQAGLAFSNRRPYYKKVTVREINHGGCELRRQPQVRREPSGEELERFQFSLA